MHICFLSRYIATYASIVVIVLNLSMTLVDQGGTWLMYFSYLLCVTKENLQNHIPKGIWDTMEGNDVAFASQLVAIDNGSDESLQV